MIRKLAVLLAVARDARACRLRLQRPAAAGRRHQGRVVRSAEPVPAPRRPGAEPRQHGQGLRRAGRGGADRGHQRARERRRHQGHARAHQRSRRRSRNSRRRRASSRARCRACWSSPRTIRTSSPTRCSATCSRSSKARRTASPSRATATSRRVQEYNTTVRQFPTNLTAMLFKMDVKPNFTVENEAAVSAPPKVDFGKAAPRRPAAPAPAPARRRPPRRPKTRLTRRRLIDPRQELMAQGATDGASASGDRACRHAATDRAALAHRARLAVRCSRCCRSSRSRRRGAWEAGPDGLMPIPPLRARVTDLTQHAVAPRSSRRSRRSSPPGKRRPATSSRC